MIGKEVNPPGVKKQSPLACEWAFAGRSTELGLVAPAAAAATAAVTTAAASAAVAAAARPGPFLAGLGLVDGQGAALELLPFIPAMASSPPVCISTNAKPRLRPVSRSLTICAPGRSRTGRTPGRGRRWWCRTKCSRRTTSYSRSSSLGPRPKTQNSSAELRARNRNGRVSCPERSYQRERTAVRQFLCDDTGLTVLEAVRSNSESEDQEGSKRDSGKASRSSW